MRRAFVFAVIAPVWLFVLWVACVSFFEFRPARNDFDAAADRGDLARMNSALQRMKAATAKEMLWIGAE